MFDSAYFGKFPTFYAWDNNNTGTSPTWISRESIYMIMISLFFLFFFLV